MISNLIRVASLFVVIGMPTLFLSPGASAMDAPTDTEAKSSQVLINRFIEQVQNEPEEMQLVLNILNYRALMLETFTGEFLASHKDNDNTSWDEAFVSFLNAENLAYAQTKDQTKEFLRNLDRLVIEEGSELSFEHLMLLERARRETCVTQKLLIGKYPRFRIGNSLPVHFSLKTESGIQFLQKELGVYGGRPDEALKTMGEMIECLDEVGKTGNEELNKLSDEIRELCDENKDSLQKISKALGSTKITDLYSGSRQLKQAYNELYIRLSWQLTNMKHSPSLRFAENIDIDRLPTAPFAVECIAAPPPCFLMAKMSNSKLRSHLASLVKQGPFSGVKNLERLSEYSNEMLKNRDKKSNRATQSMFGIFWEVATLRPWIPLRFVRSTQGISLPCEELTDLLKYHGQELDKSYTEEDKANEWLANTVLTKKKSQPRKKGGKSAKVVKAATTPPSAVVKPVLAEIKPAAQEHDTRTIVQVLKASPKKRQFVRDTELLRDVFNYDRLLEANTKHCIFRQNNADGRQVTVVLFNGSTEAKKELELADFDVTAFKRKSDAFHTISPILCSHTHLGYWLEPSTIDQDGIHQRLAHPIRFNSATQRALIIPAKIVHTPFCDKTQAIGHPGTQGAYVFLFDGQTCFHAMFHHVV